MLTEDEWLKAGADIERRIKEAYEAGRIDGRLESRLSAQPSAGEFLTREQMLAELYAVASGPVAAGMRKAIEMGKADLPLHAIKQDLGLVPVTMYQRVQPPRLNPPAPTPPGRE